MPLVETPELPPTPIVSPRPARSPGILEMLLAIVVAIGVCGVVAHYGEGRALLSRVMWNDEYITHRVLTGPDFVAPFTGGSEMNLPVYHLTLKAWNAVTLGRFAPPFGYRLLSLTLAAVAAAGVYVGLRHRFCRLTSTVGALLVLSMPETIANAYEARYYAMLLAGSAWLAAVQLRSADAPTRANRIALALLAALVTSTHWFGILSPASIGLAMLVADRFAFRRTLARTWPLIVGSCVFFLWLPLYVVQRRAMGGVSWINPDIYASGVGLVRNLFENVGVTLVAIVGALAVARRRAIAIDERPIAPLAALLLVPVLLFVASVVVQPMMVTRYAIATVAGLGVVAAMLVHRAPTWARAALAAALCVTAVVQTQAFWKTEKDRFAGVRDAEARLRAAGGTEPIYFDSIHFLSPFMQMAGKPLTDRAVYVADPAFDRTSPWYAAQRVQQGFNRATWGWPTIADVDAVADTRQFWLVGGDEAARVLRERMPGHDVRLITPTLFRVTPRATTVPAATSRPAL